MAAEAGYKPREIDDATISEIMISVEASRNLLNNERINARTIAFTIARVNGYEGTMSQFWPLPGDKEESGETPQEKLERFRKLKIQRNALKQNGNTRTAREV